MYNNVEDYLKDENFIKFILGDTTHNWNETLPKQAECLKAYDEARQILLASEDVDTEFTLQEKDELKKQIFNLLH